MTAMSTPTKYLAACILLALAAILLAACTGAGDDGHDGNDGNDGNGGSPPPGLSPAALEGERTFNLRCALCHGAGAAGGTGLGPPLVHPIYEPGHHQDFAFRNAVRNGVISHHWEFGNMPPVPGVSDAELESIICYVREQQRAQGIFDGAGC